MNSSSTIAFESASVSFDAADSSLPPKTVLSPTSVTLEEDRVAVIGANGSGKSTFLRLINGLVSPSTGRVLVNGLDPQTDPAAVRRQVGFVFTDPLSQLVMPTPLEDLELSLRRLKLRKSERRAKAQEVLAKFGLQHVGDNSIYELSGGERQLLALATVLAVEPKILVLDEPSTLLDLRNTLLLEKTLRSLDQKIVMATHNLELASRFDRVLVVEDTAITFDGPPSAAIEFYRDSVS